MLALRDSVVYETIPSQMSTYGSGEQAICLQSYWKALPVGTSNMHAYLSPRLSIIMSDGLVRKAADDGPDILQRVRHAVLK